MKNKLIYFVFVLTLLFTSCMKHDFNFNNDEQIQNNVENVFGVKFDNTHDWCTTVNGSITVYANTSKQNIVKAQVLMSYVNNDDSTYVIKLLNEGKLSNGENIELTYDTPIDYDILMIAFVNDKGGYFYKSFSLNDKEIYYENNRRLSRALSQDYNIPSTKPVINGTVETFANKRGWLPNEVFYIYDNENLNISDYDDNFKSLFKTIIFNYLPNGRKYNNLPKIKESGYYNESTYPITTNNEPVIVSPIYKNDGGYHEISEAELYYYYYTGELSPSQIEALPKYRVIDLSTVYANDDNDRVYRQHSYALAYFGDGVPEIGTVGDYYFPKGYKIGFVYKSNTTSDNKKKQGELYGDGRLNYNINHYGNFATSKLDDLDPRMGWMSVNQRMFLCIESGTDKDFNDLIIEVEGGIEQIEIIPNEPESNYYTFLYEDHNLGDYDMNDIVIKGRRIDNTTIEYTLMACGAHDNIFIHNIDGNVINNNKEVHELFGQPQMTFINTVEGQHFDYVIDTIKVKPYFSFLDKYTQPYIYDATINNTVKLATVGQDPHAIMIPYDFKWPKERVCIKDAYLQFNNWGQNKIMSTDWYKYPEENLIFIK